MLRKMTLLQSASNLSVWQSLAPQPKIHRWCVVVEPSLDQRTSTVESLVLDQCWANVSVLPTTLTPYCPTLAHPLLAIWVFL